MSDFVYEEAIARLEGIVKALEGGKVPLEESSRLFEEGMALAKACEEKLSGMEASLKRLVRNEDGELEAGPLHV